MFWDCNSCSAVVRSQNIGLMPCQQPEINVPVNFNIIHLSNGSSTMNNDCIRLLVCTSMGWTPEVGSLQFKYSILVPELLKSTTHFSSVSLIMTLDKLNILFLKVKLDNTTYVHIIYSSLFWIQQYLCCSCMFYLHIWSIYQGQNSDSVKLLLLFWRYSLKMFDLSLRTHSFCWKNFS